MAYNGSDRRASLGGISRQTFVTNALEVFGEKAEGLFGLLYDMQRCTDSKIQLANEKIDTNQQIVTAMFDGIKEQCKCRAEECDNRFIKKISDRLPISWVSFITILCLMCFMAGVGILDLTGKIDIINFFKLIVRS